MKGISLILIATAFVFNLNAQQTGSFVDPRDGRTYKTVKIGNQTWMAENLAYKPDSGNYFVYEFDTSNVTKYGYLYNWETAKKVCPTGWHLPSDTEWNQLLSFVGSEPFEKLNAKSGWNRKGNGTDIFGFSALPGGQRNPSGAFIGIGYTGYWWSSTEYDQIKAWMFYLSIAARHTGTNMTFFTNKCGFSVRCIKN